MSTNYDRLVSIFTRQVKRIDPRLLVDVDFQGKDDADWVVVFDRAPQSDPAFLDLVTFEDREDLKVWIYEFDEMDAREQEAEIYKLISRAKSLRLHPASASA